MCRTWVALAGCLLVAQSLPADDLKAAAFSPSPSEIAKLIEQLGDRDYATREAAGKRLSVVGEPALAPLAAVNSNNPEQAERAARLLVSIRNRLDNEKALAPTHVELPKGEQTLRQVFEAIEKQNRVQLRIEGDQTALARKLKLDGGNKPLWEHLQQVMTATGLNVAEVNEYRKGSVRQTEEDKTDEVVRMTPDRMSDAQKLKDHIQELNEQIANSKSDDEKAELKNDVARVTRYYQKLTEVDQRVEERMKARQSLVGRVTFKASEPARPSCVSGGVRVEATPVPANLLKRYAADQFPLMVKVQAEPGMAWKGVTELLIVEAIDDRGRSLAPTFFTPGTYTNLANDELQFQRANMGLAADEPYRLVPHDHGITALAGVAGQPVKLKSIRGVVKANLAPSTSRKPAKEVAIRFHLTDVPLVAGTGDGEPMPEEYEQRLKK
jgi:hypothetical protein